MTVRRARRPLTAWLGCAGLLLSLSQCGGSSSPRPATASQNDASRAVWASSTQQLCRQKQRAIAKLGYVHITYAGIARAGLGAVKRSLDAYLGRLLAVLRDFAQRQGRLAAPPSVAPTMRQATELDRESQLATIRLRRAVAGANTAGGLSVAFRTWTATLQRLAVRGDGLARQLGLPDCRSGSPAPPPR